MPNNEIVKFLLDLNKRQGDLFCSPDFELSRLQHRSEHPTAIASFECMDGRLNLPVMTETPLGVIKSFRNLGGKFNLGWPYLGEIIKNWVKEEAIQGRNCLLLVTYHFSKGDKHRGCRGFGYDEKLAFETTNKLKEQIERVFGKNHTGVYPVLVGIETDEDALILHGDDINNKLEIVKEMETGEEDLLAKIERLFPNMKRVVLNDLLPLIMGNRRHIAEIRKSKRPIEDMVHGERVLAVGHGFDWLYLLNYAFIVGSYSVQLETAIATAATLLLENLKEGRVPEDEGVALITSGAYTEEGIEKALARERALALAEISQNVIKERVPDLEKHIQTISGIVDTKTRRFEEIEI